MRRFRSLLVAGIIALLAFSSAVSAQYVIGDDKDPIPLAPDQGSASYAGSAACQTCHATDYSDWASSGHPYKITTPAVAQSLLGVPPSDDPLGYASSDVYRVIGGWGWKSRYIFSSTGSIPGYSPGNIITEAANGTIGLNQYNIEDGTWGNYHGGEVRVYNCQKCHNTGAQYVPGSHQDGLVGIDGTWEEDGVGCEACHGPGSEHIALSTPTVDGGAILVDTTARYCGYCHTRGSDDSVIIAKGGFNQHHEQYPELLNSPHADLDCVTCHDPHKPTHKGATNPVWGAGISVNCEDCHSGEAALFEKSSHANAGVECIDCHMAEVTKSAIARSAYEGDVKAHLFRINTDPNAESVPSGATVGNGYIDLGFACLQCHEGEMTKVEASEYIGNNAHYISVVGGSFDLLVDASDLTPTTSDVPALPVLGLAILGGTMATLAIRRMKKE